MTAREFTVADLFADYRAEWPSSHFAEYFVHPAYFRKLESRRPCFLFGGRGTGKTTALRSLRFDASHNRTARSDGTAPPVETLEYFGIYVRMDKNQVRGFEGPDLPQATWNRLFAHYFNLLACREFSVFLGWVASLRPDLDALSTEQYSHIAKALALSSQPSAHEQLQAATDSAIVDLELYINNPGQASQPLLSMAERPVREFADAIGALPWATDKPIFCCIDEYENLLDHEQSILNTYIKHSSTPLSYKVGVRSNGLHSRETTGASDPLQTPDDYIEIDIPQEGFEMFAQEVAEVRLRLASRDGLKVPPKLDDFLQQLSPDSEAELLGVDRIVEAVMDKLGGDQPLREYVRTHSSLRIALLGFWNEAHSDTTIPALAADWRHHPEQWDVRYGNYLFNLLVWLSKGRKGARTKKYYCGTQALIAMAGGNIRYFMELLDRSIAEELTENASGSAQELIALSAKSQTNAAKRVGQKRLEQLEGVSGSGVQLKRLALGVGRVFFERSRMPGTAPEQTLFTISGKPGAVNSIVALLEDGVGHLAFEASPRTKRTSVGEPKDNEYRIHPIFSAFFEISYRRKRRVAFDAEALATLIANPAAGVAHLLDAQPSDLEELPEQMALFAPFFRASGPTT